MSNKREPPFAEVSRLIRGYGLNTPQLAEILGYSKTTVSLRLDEPDRFTLGELKRICISGGVPADKIREAIIFGERKVTE